MIPKEKIKELVFARYSEYLKQAASHYSYIKRIGLHPDELVNEAIIGIIECKIEFENEAEVDAFMLNAISSVAYFEYKTVAKKDKVSSEDAKDWDFQEVNDEKPFEYSESIYAAKSEELWDVFFEYRFPQGIECPNCGCKRIHGHSAGWQCSICRTAISLKSRTYLHKTKYPFVKIYKSIELLNIHRDIQPPALSRLTGLGVYSCNTLLKLLRQVVEKTKSHDAITVIKKLLTPMRFDEDKIEINKYSFKHFSQANIEAVRQEYLDGASINSLAEKYNKRKDSIAVILKGGAKNAYNHPSKLLPLTIEKYNNRHRKQSVRIENRSINYKIPHFHNLFRKMQILENKAKQLGL